MRDRLHDLKEAIMNNLDGILIYLISIALCALAFLPLARA